MWKRVPTDHVEINRQGYVGLKRDVYEGFQWEYRGLQRDVYEGLQWEYGGLQQDVYKGLQWEYEGLQRDVYEGVQNRNRVLHNIYRVSETKTSKLVSLTLFFVIKVLTDVTKMCK